MTFSAGLTTGLWRVMRKTALFTLSLGTGGSGTLCGPYGRPFPKIKGLLDLGWAT